MADLLYEPVKTKDNKEVGFIVSWWRDTYFVPIGQISLGSQNILMGEGHCYMESEWFGGSKGKNYCWGEIKKSIKIIEALPAEIVAVREVPEWVGKTPKQAKKEMMDAEDRRWKQSKLYKLFHLFAKKGDK